MVLAGDQLGQAGGSGPGVPERGEAGKPCEQGRGGEGGK